MMTSKTKSRRALFLIENVPYSLDTRVRREAHCLMEHGASVVVICPTDGAGFRRQIAGVTVYQYFKPAMGAAFFSHVLEYVFSLVLQTILTAYVFLRHGFDVVHVANPPDLLWLVASPYKLLGRRFVFDHHDLVPELFEVRYAERFPMLIDVVSWLERMSIRLADHVISTNQTFRRIALQRGRKADHAVTVVRNGPWLEKDFYKVDPSPEVTEVGDIVVGYLGIMNPQDRVDNLLEAARIVRQERSRKDIGFVLVGSGDAYQDLLEQRDSMGLSGSVLMPGTIPWRGVLEAFAAVDIAVQPDLPTPFNQHLTMNKLMEYMALGKAVIAYDMPETRVSGGDCIKYLSEHNASVLADAIIALADDRSLRTAMGQKARQRIEDDLSWEKQRSNLVDVYRKIGIL